MRSPLASLFDKTFPDEICDVIEHLERQNALLKGYLAAQVDTLDTRIFEWASITPDPTTFNATLTVQPQTSQLELIEGIVNWVGIPTDGTQPTTDGGTVTIGPFSWTNNGGNIQPWDSANYGHDLAWLLNEHDPRTWYVDSDGGVNETPFGFPFTMYMILWGRAIPATMGEVLH